MMNDNDSDRLKNYMGGPSLNMGFKYINTRASGLRRYLFERSIQTLCAWVPGPLGLIIRSILYKPFLHRNSHWPFIEAGTDFFYMSSMRFGKGVYIDKHCRLHASQAEIELGSNNRVMRGAYICTYVSNARQGEGIVTGSDCWIGVNAVLGSGQGGLFLGNNILIAPNVVIVTGNHDYQRVDLTAVEQAYNGKPINIGDNVWVGANSVVVGGVTIGEHAVISAGSVVTKDVEPYTVSGGVPSRKLRNISKDSDLKDPALA